MAMENKRIIQLNTERTTPAADDYVMVDSATAGTAKYLLPKITDAIDQEISDRTSADTALQTAITNETTARANADTTLQGNITAEATARAEADTAINGEITQLKEDLSQESNYQMLLCDEVPDTVQSYTFSGGSVSQVAHNRSNTAIRTDVFTYTDNTITEVRTLNTGESLTIVTNLTTLETTVTYAAA